MEGGKHEFVHLFLLLFGFDFLPGDDGKIDVYFTGRGGPGVNRVQRAVVDTF